MCRRHVKALRMSSFKLVTFDVTGTLLFFRVPILEKYAELGSKFGLEINARILEKNFNEAWIHLNRTHPNFGRDTGLGWQNWWERFVEKTFSSFVKQDEKHKISEMVKNLIDFHTTEEAFTIRPGTGDLLQYLKSQSLQMGVISNYDPRLSQILQLVDLNKYFNFVLISYELGYEKPDPRIFKAALELSDCSSGREAFHIGDDIVTDYLGAKKAGWRAALMSSREEVLNNSQVQRNEVFKDFFELKAYFQRIKLN